MTVKNEAAKTKAKVLVVLGACIVTIFSVTAVAGMGALPQPVLNLGVITAGLDLGSNNQTTQPVQLLPEEVGRTGFYVNLSCAINDTIRHGTAQLRSRGWFVETKGGEER